MPYSEPTDLAVVACPGGESFANEVITHLRHMYKHRFTLKNDVISKRYGMDKDKLVQQINLDNDLRTFALKELLTNIGLLFLRLMHGSLTLQTANSKLK